MLYPLSYRGGTPTVRSMRPLRMTSVGDSIGSYAGSSAANTSRSARIESTPPQEMATPFDLA